MRLVVSDGGRKVAIDDPATVYDAAVLADWCRRAAALLAEQTIVPVSQHPASTIERAEQFDHDRRQPLGFGGAR